jgi:hypothetical protein
MLKQCTHLSDLKDFPDNIALSICDRHPIANIQAFFDVLMQIDFSISGLVSKDNTIQDIEDIISEYIPNNLKGSNSYKQWIQDMANICHIFCDIQKSEHISFWLGTKRGCKRYHLDYVPMRLLVTYAGAGTQWIPHEASDWNAYANGGTNDVICKDINKIETIKPWDVAIFRGREKGVLHRTPDDAMNNPSIFMRLDIAEFQKKLLKMNAAG